MRFGSKARADSATSASSRQKLQLSADGALYLAGFRRLRADAGLRAGDIIGVIPDHSPMSQYKRFRARAQPPQPCTQPPQRCMRGIRRGHVDNTCRRTLSKTVKSPSGLGYATSMGTLHVLSHLGAVWCLLQGFTSMECFIDVFVCFYGTFVGFA